MRKILYIAIILTLVFNIMPSNAFAQVSNNIVTPPNVVFIDIKNGQFVPQDATVGIGGNVLWYNRDGTAHEIVSDNPSLPGAWDSGLKLPDSAYNIRALTPGVYTYHDALNPAATGILRVASAISTNTAPVAVPTTVTTVPTTVTTTTPTVTYTTPPVTVLPKTGASISILILLGFATFGLMLLKLIQRKDPRNSNADIWQRRQGEKY